MVVGWDKIKLIDHSTLKARIGWQGLTTAEYLDEGEAFLVTGTDFVNGAIKWNTCHYVDKFRFDQDTNIQLRNGDILITKDGTIGKVAFVEGLSKKATLNSGVFVLRPKDTTYDSRYMYYVLLSDTFLDFLSKLSAGSTITHLYQKDFVTFECEIPKDINEQCRIAEVLSDTDALISALEKLIDKKRAIKQGTMQELLTGKRRLDGFNGEWVEKSIEDTGKICIGLTHTPTYVNTGVPFLSVKDVKNNKINFSNVKYISYDEYSSISEASKPKRGDIIFGRVGTLGNPCIVDFDFDVCIFVSLGFIKVYKEHCNKFIALWLASEEFVQFVNSKIAGSSQKNLNTGWLSEFMIKLPPTLEEQTAIASILTDMDAEIAALNTKIDKLRNIKQGMMSELLSGRIRLKEEV